MIRYHSQQVLIDIGEDVLREGLVETPDRITKAYAEMFDGYDKCVDEVIKTFVDGSEDSRDSEMIVMCNIPVYSHCEHHMAPIFGQIHLGYIPSGKIVGLSKFKRVVDVFAHRLQVQERLTRQVADAFQSALDPGGVIVVMEARHMCMEMRGVNTAGTITQTTALRGVFEQHVVRAEFLSHVARQANKHI